jgi:hypothetical protein
MSIYAADLHHTVDKSTSSQLPTALRLGNTVTTDKYTIVENFTAFF